VKRENGMGWEGKGKEGIQKWTRGGEEKGKETSWKGEWKYTCGLPHDLRTSKYILPLLASSSIYSLAFML
jgi:hypothetical protein